MPFSNGNIVWNETKWTPKMIRYIKKNFWKRTNVQLATELKVGLTVFRNKIRELGLKKIEMEYFTAAQTKFLKQNYKKMGDTELAEIFEKKWPKKKKWTNKHIRKKRIYLKLDRSENDIIGIMQRYVDQGRLNRHSKGKSNWLTKGPAKQKEIRMYKSCAGVISPRIKIGRRWMWWQRWAWEQKYGPVPDGMVVVFKNGNSYKTKVSNLELVSRRDAAFRYVATSGKKLTKNYIASLLKRKGIEQSEDPDLVETYRVLLQLKRKIKYHETAKRSAGIASASIQTT